MKNKKTIMALGAHHDDIELDYGGTLVNYIKKGWNVIYTIATTTPYYMHSEQDIKEGRYPSNKEIIDIRKREAEEGAKILGISDISFFDFKSLYWYEDKSINLTHFDGIKNTCDDLARIEKEIPGREYIVSALFSKDATDFLSDFILSKKVDIILTHSADDEHWEHYAVAGLTATVCRQLVAKGKDIKLFNGPPSLGGSINRSFAPTRFVDITDSIDIKCKAVSAFKSQYPDRDTSEFVEHILKLGKIYGQLSGFEYAEAFMDGLITYKKEFSPPITYDASKALIGFD
jgi:LmbE family N-acetylglucosaminyl deacetylase